MLVVQGLVAQENGFQSKGTLTDATNGEAIAGATVLFVNVKDSTRSRFSTSNQQGEFIVKRLEQAFYKVHITSIGYKPYVRVIRVTEEMVILGNIKLEQDVEILDAVEVKGEVLPVEQKGDTVQYNADAFKVNPDASAKDLVSKMPGIEVSESGVKANGETIEQVLLDGKRFFGRDPLLSLNTIPAEVVNRVEVFDQRSEQSQFTGFDDGNTTKTMNVVTRENKRNGLFGKAFAGYGTDKRYNAGGNINSFDKDKRITLMGMSNSINLQNFSSEDLGLSGGGGRRGFGGGGSSFATPNQNGITTTNAIGLNISDNWGKKTSFEGSYFFNMKGNSNNQYSDRESFSPAGSRFYDEERMSSSENKGHNLNMRVTYNINEKNKLIFIPQFSLQDNLSTDNTLGTMTDENGVVLNKTDNAFVSDRFNYRLNNQLILQHKMEKIGRSISFDLRNQISNTDNKDLYRNFTLDSITEYVTDRTGNSIGTGITYTEPVGLSGQLSMSYEFTYNDTDSKLETYFAQSEITVKDFSQALSNTFSSYQLIHRPGVHIMNRSQRNFYRAGLSFQGLTLNSDQVYPEENTFSNQFYSLLPEVMGRWELGGNVNIFGRYAGNTNIPSVSQLQNVINNSDPLFWSVGNPELRQSYFHSLFMRISKTNSERNTMLSNFTRAQLTANYVTNASVFIQADSTLAKGIVIPRGAQLTSPVNLDGYRNLMNNTTYSLSIDKIKLKVNSTLGFSYVRSPGLTNGETNISNNYGGNAQFGLASNISEKVDFNVSYTAGLNKVFNTLPSRTNIDYLNQSVSGKINLIFGKGFVFRSDINYLDYKGINKDFNTYYTLWNMALAKKFLKNDAGELELSVFDLLRQNQSVSQTIEAGYIQETRTEVLRQFFMAKFTYSFRKFKKSGKE